MLSLKCCILCTRVQVITVNVGAAVAAADAAEGGDGISVAVAVAEKKKQGLLLKTKFVIAYCVDLMEKLYSFIAVVVTFLYLYESLLLIVSCPESSCSSPATLKHTFFPLRSPFSPSHSADM